MNINKEFLTKYETFLNNLITLLFKNRFNEILKQKTNEYVEQILFDKIKEIYNDTKEMHHETKKLTTELNRVNKILDYNTREKTFYETEINSLSDNIRERDDKIAYYEEYISKLKSDNE